MNAQKPLFWHQGSRFPDYSEKRPWNKIIPNPGRRIHVSGRNIRQFA